MPTSAADTEITYIGNGVTVAFPFPFEVSKASHFEATIDGAVVTAYTLSGLGVDTGGTCSFTDPPDSLAEIVLARVAPYARTDFDYQEGGELAANTLDEDIDRAVMLSQQLATALKRVPQVKRGDLSRSLTLTPEASKLLAWDSSAAGLVNVDPVTISPSTTVLSAIGAAIATAADAASAIVTLGAAQAIGQVGGRLCLDSAAPTKGGVSSTNLFYMPFTGNYVGLFNTATGIWEPVPLVSASCSIASLTNTRPFDVFAFESAGQVAIQAVSWTNATTRAAAISLQDGVWIKTSDKRRLIGWGRVRGGAINDGDGYLELCNLYNRLPRQFAITDSTDSWTYSTAAFRIINNAGGNVLPFVVGIANDFKIEAHMLLRCINSSASLRMVGAGIGLDSAVNIASIYSLDGCTSGVFAFPQAHLVEDGTTLFGTVGEHALWPLEYGTGSGDTQTWYGDNAQPTLQKSGMYGFGWV